MNIENLTVGQVIKNYKALCAELEITVKSSKDTKNAQFKELARYCDFVKDGHSFIIKEIYDTPKEKVDGRGKSEGSRRSIYGNAVQLLITDLLAQSKGYITISKHKMMLSIGMINVNYGECGQHVKKLAQAIEIDKKFIYEFYNINNSNFTKMIESALNNLEDKSIIMYSKIIKVREQGKFTTRKATQSEVSQILECEKETLDELGFEDKSKVRVSSKWMLFKKETQNKLNKCTEISSYFSAYEITINQKYIEAEINKLADLLLEQVTREETKSDLNSKIIEHFIHNSTQRKDNTNLNDKKAKVRNDFNYIENMKQLASLLLDKKATTSLLVEVRNIEIQKELPLDLLNECEDLFG